WAGAAGPSSSVWVRWRRPPRRPPPPRAPPPPPRAPLPPKFPEERAELMLDDPRLLKSRVDAPRPVSRAVGLRTPLVSRPPKPLEVGVSPPKSRLPPPPAEGVRPPRSRLPPPPAEGVRPPTARLAAAAPPPALPASRLERLRPARSRDTSPRASDWRPASARPRNDSRDATSRAWRWPRPYCCATPLSR